MPILIDAKQRKTSAFIKVITQKKRQVSERHSKGHFFKNTVHLERVVPYFAFVYTKAVLVRKISG